jgi:pimeloyl-ACP methyl ester carboxylesterase
MNDPGGGRGRLLPVAAAGAATAVAAGWAAQHRLVSRAARVSADPGPEGLVLPGDLTHHFVEVDDGARIHVVERGRGRDVVLLHGVLLSSAVWVHQLVDLAADHRVLALDFRGHGQSLPGREGFGLAGSAGAREADPAPGRSRRRARRRERSPGIGRLARDVQGVLEALDVRDALLVGHSMGGMVALQLVNDAGPALAPRVSGLALASTTAGPVVSVPGWSRWVRLTGAASSRGVLLADRAGVSRVPSRDLRWWAARFGFGAEAPPAQVRFVEELLSATPSSTFGGLVSSVAGFDLSRRLPDLDVPALVIAGTHDRLTPLRHARRLAHRLPEAELVELARCGHVPMLERRFEFARLLEEFSAKRSRRGHEVGRHAV